VAGYDTKLLDTAWALLRHQYRTGSKQTAADLRRCVSTTYYALFHFVLAEATQLLVGARNDLRWRRNKLVREFSHEGLLTTFAKIRGGNVDKSVEDLLRPRGVSGGSVASPLFAQDFARTFVDVQAKRNEADYDLNKRISYVDAHLLFVRVQLAIQDWEAANSPQDRDFRHALSMLMMLKGKWRQ
jgi:hypothetical protein